MLPEVVGLFEAHFLEERVEVGAAGVDVHGDGQNQDQHKHHVAYDKGRVAGVGLDHVQNDRGRGGSIRELAEHYHGQLDADLVDLAERYHLLHSLVVVDQQTLAGREYVHDAVEHKERLALHVAHVHKAAIKPLHIV